MAAFRILVRFPDQTILGEEGVAKQAPNAPRWLLDPIDGTDSFGRGIPVWGTLIAFEREGSSRVGVASAPALEGRATIETSHSVTSNGLLHDQVVRRLRG